MLLHFGVTPYLVFDGDYLPSKATTESDRAEKREKSRAAGLELYKLGKLSQAHLELQKAIDVTPELARQLIEELKQNNVQYIVAPYEADAQLVYLERNGTIQGILSEDSDLLVFGAKRLLTKLDQYGECLEINRNDFTACREISLVGWTDAEFRRMAILSGCDYLANINKMGLKTAYRLVRKYRNIEKIIRMLQFDGQYHVPSGYLEAFRKAELTFLHQRVFCPVAEAVIPMTDLDAGVVAEDLAFIGDEMEPNVAKGVARGDLHPMTKETIRVTSMKNSAPATPWSVSRTYSTAASSDLKPKRPIESFFKRQPLAELDPNCFTPSPSQQRLLDQRGGSQSSNSAPARSLSRSDTSTPMSDHVTNRTRLAANGRNGNGQSNEHTVKRPRLCAEGSEGASTSWEPIKAENERSRFFTPAASTLSPSVLKNRRGKKAKDANFNIWSDDSIEEAMIEFAEVSESQTPSREAGVESFKDSITQLPSPPSSKRQSSPQVDSRFSVITNTATYETAQEPQSRTRDSSSAKTRHVSSQAGILVQEPDQSVNVELSALAAKFLYNSKPVPRDSQSSSSGLPDSSQSCVRTGSSDAEHKDTRRKLTTPLQRLGARALNRSLSCSSIQSTPLREKLVDESRARGSIHRQPISLPSPPLRIPESPPQSGLYIVTQGSEDFIVPDSEDEGDEEFVAPATITVPQPKLDLGKFTYAK